MPDNKKIKGRFAPSPTGRMHAGNIFSALMSWLIVKSQGGSIVLRIEDLDKERSKTHFIDAVQHDLEDLGLLWDEGPFFQHDRDGAYQEAFQRLQDLNLVYPCYCTRADLHAASAPHVGDHFVYAGTCKPLSDEERASKAQDRRPAMRLAVPDRVYAFEDLIQGWYQQNLVQDCGDIIIRRSDGAFAYQLAVVVDDAAQGITSITRGTDLLSSTPPQGYLQDLLGYERPDYAHVPLLVDEDGRRLSKRQEDASLDALLAQYGTYQGVLGHIAYISRLQGHDEPTTPHQLLERFDIYSYKNNLSQRETILWH